MNEPTMEDVAKRFVVVVFVAMLMVAVFALGYISGFEEAAAILQQENTND